MLGVARAPSPADSFKDRIARHADQRHLQSLDGRQQPENLFRLAAGRERQHQIPAHHHSQVAVDRVYRMHEQSRGPGRTQRGRNLARDNATLAHARNHDPARAGVDQLDRLVESFRHRACDAVSQRGQRIGLNPDYVLADMFHGRKRC